MPFPARRMRRLRSNDAIRSLMRETHLSADDFVMPLFVCPGKKVRNQIPAMPGNYQLSPDELVKEARLVAEAGIQAILLFGVPGRKDAEGRVGCSPKGIVQKAVGELKKRVPELFVITDVCNCAYTTHGHCGPVVDGDIDNDRTLAILCEQALSHAEAGADMVAPSDMMDGRVGRIRQVLDDGGHSGVSIMSYAAKYASAFYGPFRDAADSAPRFGDRRTYQMDPANGDEALREVALDVEEGADIVMVKPALSYLDIVRRVKDRFDAPVAAYNVSGEFSMVKAAAAKGWIDEQRVMMEMLTSIKRAGADVIITYYAVEAARRLEGRSDGVVE